jgi:hypothetical protein
MRGGEVVSKARSDGSPSSASLPAAERRARAPRTLSSRWTIQSVGMVPVGRGSGASQPDRPVPARNHPPFERRNPCANCVTPVTERQLPRGPAAAPRIIRKGRRRAT